MLNKLVFILSLVRCFVVINHRSILFEGMATEKKMESEAKSWKVEIATWNVASFPPPADLNLTRMFGDKGDGVLDADVIAVGLQEVDFYAARYLSGVVTLREEAWGARFEQFLSQHDYVKLTCGWMSRPRLMGVILMIFVKRKNLLSIQRIESKFCRTGFSGYSFQSHKGAVSVRLTLADGSFVTFLCVHFAPNMENLSYRIKEYHMVLNCIRFDDKSVISADYIFWLGDLNMRVEGFTVEESTRLIETNYLEKLLEYDQLKRCMAAEQAFYHFHEAPITFRPTYKYLLGTSDFDLRRIPSWCDRILYRVESAHRQAERQLDCQPLRYESKPEFANSDHKPVTASFRIRVHNLGVSPLLRFLFPSATGTWLTGQNNQCKYVVSRHYSPGTFDWIGVFKPDFKSDNDVITWTYTVTSWEESKSEDGGAVTNTLFKMQHIPPAGTYMLGYYSRDRSCLIAVSAPFEVSSPSVDDAVEASES